MISSAKGVVKAQQRKMNTEGNAEEQEEGDEEQEESGEDGSETSEQNSIDNESHGSDTETGDSYQNRRQYPNLNRMMERTRMTNRRMQNNKCMPGGSKVGSTDNSAFPLPFTASGTSSA
jgi:hypothetical protein